jgi:mannose-6-phosphate isomerase-like protein (cupin superfamily)
MVRICHRSGSESETIERSGEIGTMDNLEIMRRERDSFDWDGFIGPIALFTRAQCKLVMCHFRRGNPPAPLKWGKGQAASDCFVFGLATRPALLARLRVLLGNDILLWGASLITREPNQIHPWHCDIESSALGRGFVSVWIGIENTSRESALQLITRSHAIGKTIQQVTHENGVRRGEASTATVLDCARTIIPSAEFVQPAMNDGDAVFFDGRLWHGSWNTRVEGTRAALLFQYAAAGTPVKMPDFSQLEWPFRFKRSRVPVLLVSGGDSSRANYIVPPPEPITPVLASQFHPLKLPLPEDRVARWHPHHLFAGATTNVSHMSAHVSVLSPGHSPHPPHAHYEEEILVVLDGEAELVIALNETGRNTRCEQLGAGSFVYYPAFQFHTIRNATAKPITYLMLKWTGPPRETEEPFETVVKRTKDMGQVANLPFATQFVLEGPTHYLDKLHVHLTELQPGAGYAIHADTHDVAIVLLSGSVETMGRRIERHGVVHFPAGEMHDMKNPGSATAHYLVFEFHGSLSGEVAAWRSEARTRSLWQALGSRVYSRFRQSLAATPLWHALRPIYRQLPRIFVALI